MKTLVKSKIRLEDNGTAIMLYMWKPTFKNFLPNIIGDWFPCGTCSSMGKFSNEDLDKISVESVADVLYNNFIGKRNPYKDNLLIWLKTRIFDTQSEYNITQQASYGTGMDYDHTAKDRLISKGGKLKGYKEVQDYVNSHS